MRISDWSSDVCSSDLSDRNARISTASRFVRITLQSIVLGAGALLVIDGSITAGMMIVCSILMGKALGPVEQAIGAWRQMLNTRQAYIRLDEILTEAPQRGDTLSLPAPKGHLRLENVFASAPGGQRSEEHTSELQSQMRISYAV